MEEVADVVDEPEFRNGGPNPAGLAAEVAFFRTLPLTLAPTSPVGTLPGEGRVDAGGAAHYSIPIETTPGPRGMQPKLAISYDSNSDGGAVGHRFDLAGLSAITRCTGTVADDGAFRPIRFEDGDPLCFDGERLVLVSGVDGQAGAEYRTAADPFARVVLDDDVSEFGSSFTVHTQGGQILTYGTSPASMWVGSTGGALIPWRWSILQACDRFDNCVDYEYEHGSDLGNGPTELRVTAIRYGGVGAPASRRAVTFSWVARPDVVTRYVFGAQVRREKLLDRVTVSGPNAAVVRSYRFTYQQHAQTGRSRLDDARLCDAASVCLPATEFEWSADASSNLVADEWESDGLAEQQVAFLRAPNTLAGDFDGDASEELLFRSDDPEAPWLMWYRANDEGDPTIALPLLDNILPPRVPSLSDGGIWAVAPYLAYLGKLAPEFTMSVVDFNGDVLDDVLMPVRGGWPSESGGFDGAGIPYAQQFMIAANHDGSHFATYYIDDGSEDPIYQMVPLDHDGDQYTDVWMCRGSSATEATWVLAHHRGGDEGEFGFDFFDTGVGCSAFDEYTVSSVDGGPASLLVIAAHAPDGAVIPSGERDHYRRLRFDVDTQEALLEAVGLPRDRYQRTHDRYCRNAAAEVAGGSPTSTSGPGMDRHIDLNGDGFADVLRFELASGDDAGNPAVADGMITAVNDIAALLDGSDWSTVSLCGADVDLSHDAVLAVYYNTGDGYIRGPDALEFEDNAHAQLWLNFAAAPGYDLEDDGRLDLLMPAVGPGTGWTQLEVDATGAFETHAFPGPQGWPAYDDDDTWRDQLAVATGVRVMSLGNGGGVRPSLVFAGDIEDSEDLPLWVNLFSISGEDEDEGVGRVETVTDGLGGTTRFEYRAVYEPTKPAAEWPKAPFRASLWVATAMEQSITRTDGSNEGPGEAYVEAVRRRQYDYKDATFDRRGRGFLGFGRVRVQELVGGQVEAETLSEYDQTYDPSVDGYPALGRPLRREVFTPLDSGDIHLTRELWTWHVRELPQPGGMTSLAYAAEHREMATQVPPGQCDLGTTWWWTPCPHFDAHEVYRDVTTTETRDDFGTLVTSVEWTTEGDGPVTQVDQTQIVHDQARWLLGQVGKVTVQTCSGGTCAARVTETEFDPETGAVDEVTIQPDDPSLELVSTFNRDVHGNVTFASQTGATGTSATETRTSATLWDAEGVFPLMHGNALGHASYVVHDPTSGMVIAEVDPAGLTNKQSFDGLYRVVGSAVHSSPMGGDDGAPTTIEYLPDDGSVDGTALIVRSTTANGLRVTEYVSSAGDPLERRWQGMADLPPGNPETVPAGADVYERYGYDERGRHVARSVPQWVGMDPAGWHRRSLDGLGRVLEKIAPDGTVLEEFEYRPLGLNNATVVDITSSKAGEPDILRSKWLDQRGLPLRDVDADGVATCFVHGPFDTLASTERNCLGAGTRLLSTTAYDALGHATSQTDPHLGTRTSTWNGFGELIGHTDAAARTTTYDYDGIGRLVARVEPEGTASFVYDTERLGALASDVSPNGVTRLFSVDTFGRTWRATTGITTPSGNDGYRFEWTYGPGGRVAQVSYPTPDNEPTVVARYVYDQAGYLRIVKDHATGALRWSLDTATPSALPKTESYGDGTATTRTYDPQREWVEAIVHTKPGQTLSQLAYVWSPEGELTQRSDAIFGQSEALEYDRQWRVTRSTVSGTGTPAARDFAYDIFLEDAEVGDIWSLYEVGIVGPALWVAEQGGENLSAIVSTAQMFADEPVEATVAVAKGVRDQVVADAGTVVSGVVGVGEALADGDVKRAREAWVDAAVSAYSIASVIVGGGGSKVASVGRRSAGAATGTVGGFRSFSSFKRAMGPAGVGKEWHHIVGQTKLNKSRFGPHQLHSTGNLIRLDANVHRAINGHYSSYLPGTRIRIRDWIGSHSYATQHAYGMQVLRNFGVVP